MNYTIEQKKEELKGKIAEHEFKAEKLAKGLKELQEKKQAIQAKIGELQTSFEKATKRIKEYQGELKKEQEEVAKTQDRLLVLQRQEESAKRVKGEVVRLLSGLAEDDQKEFLSQLKKELERKDQNYSDSSSSLSFENGEARFLLSENDEFKV